MEWQTDQDGLSLHLGVPEPEPGVREERRHPEETALHHLLRAEGGEDERPGGGGQTPAPLSSSLVISSHLQARAKQRIAEDMRKDFERDRDKLKKVSSGWGCLSDWMYFINYSLMISEEDIESIFCGRLYQT